MTIDRPFLTPPAILAARNGHPFPPPPLLPDGPDGLGTRSACPACPAITAQNLAFCPDEGGR